MLVGYVCVHQSCPPLLQVQGAQAGWGWKLGDGDGGWEKCWRRSPWASRLHNVSDSQPQNGYLRLYHFVGFDIRCGHGCLCWCCRRSLVADFYREEGCWQQQRFFCFLTLLSQGPLSLRSGALATLMGVAFALSTPLGLRSPRSLALTSWVRSPMRCWLSPL